ncbi:DUF3570 domain-containing protein [Flagellimonas nanhaiensis]|uniref:DUF3570 domain-containing protein n=1 Tax=Flagellimonas nanhaiensis TaxID=2292706 RepID=A0A371JU90_9FLAO|nr:DUF3570 domain-containing protein [Allomuricauda nanhaiensis]RDY61368.1 DUF3570 domain-containing protein [Allomuricauda nanhaiensis]
MNKRTLLVGSLAFSLFFSKAQTKKSETFKVNETEVELLYNHYVQNGDNSAVTGGEGTERLIVYGPTFNYKKKFGKNALDFQIGVDIISSASTDNIDRIVSSASRLDARTYSNAHYTRYFEKSKMSISLGLGASVESDYFSFGKFLGFFKTSKNDMRTYTAQLQIFNDDLRWGRLDGGFLQSPQFLIYPVELRFQEWYDEYKRDSYNLNLGFTQVVNQRNTVGLFTVLSLQKGLLATPFHRIYFSDNSRAVEQFPDERYKAALSLKWNSFASGGVIFKNKLGGYLDNFGILGLTIDNETAIKLSPRWTLLPSFRFYTQQASKYFAPRGEHNPSERYYTSDYDFSSLSSYRFGMGWRHWPAARKNKGLHIFSVQYFYYSRSNGLKAHTLSTSFNFLKKRRVRRKKSK